jgi:dipeptidase E
MPHLIFSELLLGQRSVEKAIQQAARKPLETLYYIPTRTEKDRKSFHEVCKQYKGIFSQEPRYCDLDKEYDEELFADALTADAIYLAGGSVASLLTSIHKHELIFSFQDFVEAEGILIGESAGAIVMGATTDIALEFSSEQQEFKKIKDTSGIGVYDFEFLPHYLATASEIEKLERRAKNLKTVILACPDGSGVILDQPELRAVGAITVFRPNQTVVFRDQKIEL